MLDRPDVKRLTAKYDIGSVPGYLSYPVVTKWNQPIAPREVAELCRRPKASDDAYLYFHFPYCQTLCYYCACYMKVTANPDERYDDYLRALETELALKLGSRHEPLGAGEMHWGGGTPTYMSCAQIERAFAAINRYVRWKPRATWSVEAYPDARTLDEQKLRVLRSLGFSQVSFGIESLDPMVLRAINRSHDEASIRHWIETARALGFGIHVDVVYGLPHQTPAAARGEIIYHFQGYEPLSRQHFLGFGSSAISFAGDRYFKNTGSLNAYAIMNVLSVYPLPAVWFAHDGAACLASDDGVLYVSEEERHIRWAARGRLLPGARGTACAQADRHASA